MPMNKPHLEFHKIDMNSGLHHLEGYPPTIQEKILASDLDERRKMGSRTRLLRFDPGAFTTAPFVRLQVNGGGTACAPRQKESATSRCGS